jgi:hypothetical protein
MVTLNQFGEPDRGPWPKVWVARQPGLARSLYDVKPADLLAWNGAVPAADIAAIDNLSVWSDQTRIEDALPHSLLSLIHLRYLSLPSQICRQLTPELMPASVAWLTSELAWDKTAWRRRVVRFDPDAAFPNVRELGDGKNCYRCSTRFRFEPKSFRNLEVLSLTLDGNETMLETVCALERLQLLRLSGFRSLGATCARIAPLGLTSLCLGGTHRHPDLSGIGQLGPLRHLKLIGFSALTDLAPLRDLEQLESIGLYWLTRLADIRPLLDLPKLKRIARFGCRLSRRWQPVIDAALQRGIDVTT